ncbi:Uma2 family endonuclease [Spirosoma fluviale]|uniref:Endonuclease, Uma2 family (Restriction endonuclease fold) n=1 Tax=Spirosoma fluviale TaxID=1597977 RepID=A0A286G9B6_9BACT|nr:Uma2 family endonuclease [Spirosoma fluviale]SOD92075.1 Endonuclease, Uma2 family (restriction endonuclease fold) [Spirosoma fluviale]
MMFPLNPTTRRDDRLTDDEFYAFCQANPSLRIEREANGQIVFEMPTNTKTGLRNADLIIEIGIWNRRSKLGMVADSSAGFTLPDTSVRAPDVSWISNERWNALSENDQGKFARICPDFVIELMSDLDEKYTLPAKMEKYLQNGLQLGWVVDPFNQQVTIYRPDREPQIKTFSDELTGDNVLRGFSIRLIDLM